LKGILLVDLVVLIMLAAGILFIANLIFLMIDNKRSEVYDVEDIEIDLPLDDELIDALKDYDVTNRIYDCECPFCKSIIRSDVIICKYCKVDLSTHKMYAEMMLSNKRGIH
jgi:hypothetical protein